MDAHTTSEELRERLALIESMIAEGRRRTESWGWTFLLWGVAYYVAIVWSTWGQTYAVLGRYNLAWPATMLGAAVLTVAIAAAKGKGQPDTAISRAVGSVWMALGISMVLVFLSLSLSGRLDQHSFVSLVAAMLGAANGASGMILRWKMQWACAVVWWFTAIVSGLVTDSQLAVLFPLVIFLCQIAFGAYAMWRDSQRRGRVAHA